MRIFAFFFRCKLKWNALNYVERLERRYAFNTLALLCDMYYTRTYGKYGGNAEHRTLSIAVMTVHRPYMLGMHAKPQHTAENGTTQQCYYKHRLYGRFCDTKEFAV